MKERKRNVRLLGGAESDTPLPADYQEPEPGRFATVYRCYRRDRTLLYVGLTGISGLQRFSQHSQTKEWWVEVHSIEVEHFPRMHLARMRERELISTMKPLYNKAGSTRPKGPYNQRRVAVERAEARRRSQGAST